MKNNEALNIILNDIFGDFEYRGKKMDDEQSTMAINRFKTAIEDITDPITKFEFVNHAQSLASFPAPIYSPFRSYICDLKLQLVPNLPYGPFYDDSRDPEARPSQCDYWLNIMGSYPYHNPELNNDDWEVRHFGENWHKVVAEKAWTASQKATPEECCKIFEKIEEFMAECDEHYTTSLEHLEEIFAVAAHQESEDYAESCHNLIDACQTLSEKLSDAVWNNYDTSPDPDTTRKNARKAAAPARFMRAKVNHALRGIEINPS